MNELMQLYEVLTQKGMINLSPEEFSQLPEQELMKYASLLQEPAQQPMQQQGQPGMQEMQPMMRTGGPMYRRVGGRSRYDTGDIYNPYGEDYDPGLAEDATTADGAITGRGGFSWADDAKGRAGQTGAGIASMAGNIAGNALKNPNKVEGAANIGGNLLTGAATGAAMGSAFGPWGTAIGAIAGTIGGGIKSAQQAAAHRKDVTDRGQGRLINGLSNSYNPEMARGGYVNGEAGGIDDYRTMSPKAGDAAELARVRNMPFTQFSSQRGSLSRNSRVRKAGSPVYATGGYAPNLHMQDGGAAADAEIEGGEAVIGNPNAVDLYGGADASHTSPWLKVHNMDR
jgi:hypothetical protein